MFYFLKPNLRNKIKVNKFVYHFFNNSREIPFMKDSKEAFLKKLGERIAEIRIKKGITQSELALRCEKDKQSINRLEKGNVNPSIYYLIEVAKALDIPLTDIFAK